MTKETELAIYDQNKFVEIFTEKTGDSFIEKLEKEVADFQKTSDMSSKEGRKAIRSYSYELSQHKAPLKKAKLQITEEVRNTITALNLEENSLLDRIQELQDEVRKPLTDFENKEKKRIEVRRNRIEAMETILVDANCGESINQAIDKLQELMNFKDDWGVFTKKAEDTFLKMSNFYKNMASVNLKREAEQAELEKLRKEKEEKEKKEREEQIIRETEENIRRVEREKAEKVAKEAEEQRYRLEAEKKAAEQAKIDAENRIVEVAKRAREEKEHAKNRAKAVQEEAIRLERARAEAQRQKEIDEEKARAQNLEHKTKIYKEIIAALLPYINNNLEATAKTKAIIAGIAKGKIPYISIRF